MHDTALCKAGSGFPSRALSSTSKAAPRLGLDPSGCSKVFVSVTIACLGALIAAAITSTSIQGLKRATKHKGKVLGGEACCGYFQAHCYCICQNCCNRDKKQGERKARAWLSKPQKAPCLAGGFQHIEGEVRGLERVKNDLDHPAIPSTPLQPLLTAACLTCPSSDSPAASSSASPPGYLNIKPESSLCYSLSP